ncbi:MAG: response regulator [Deltaproteobacteria bacterium]|nr:response regulator [Deltaproteobacteria bacterium]
MKHLCAIDRLTGTDSTRHKILIMDDEEVIRDLISEVLIGNGFSACSAADGTEAVRLYREAIIAGEPFDAVILDLSVPKGIGGKATIDTLLEIDPQVKAIVSSGYPDDPIVQDYKRHGFRGVLLKPCDIASISSIIDEALKD